MSADAVLDTDEVLYRRVELIISEPWELATEAGVSAPVLARIVSQGNSSAADDVEQLMVLELDTPIEYRGARYHYFVARRKDAEWQGGHPEEFLGVFSLYGVTGDVMPDPRSALSAWRGGLGVVASLVTAGGEAG